ncbi:MAG: DUF6046 domain-containing protein, partial [Bacteroidota bacterium]
MADFDVSINNLFERAFGFNRGRPFDAGQLNDESSDPASFDTPSINDSEGTEFVTLRNELNARLPDGRLLFMPISIGGVLLPNEPTISLRKNKHIVKTKMVGSNAPGTVKELVSSGDWSIVIRGVAVNFDSVKFYPEDQVKQLRDLDAREQALEVRCALTSLLGIYRLVIEKFSLPEMVGISHAQAY